MGVDDVLMYRRAVVNLLLSVVGKEGMNKSAFIKELLKLETASRNNAVSKKERFMRKVKEGIGLPGVYSFTEHTLLFCFMFAL